MKYYYYVTYHFWKDKEYGIGACFSCLECKLNKRERIDALKESIEKEGNFDLVIIENWKRIKRYK